MVAKNKRRKFLSLLYISMTLLICIGLSIRLYGPRKSKLETILSVKECEAECDDPISEVKGKSLVHDKESAYDLFSKASKRLSSILPQDPDWDDYPPQLVLDPSSKRGLLNNALQAKMYDPTEIADILSAEGANLELRNIQRGVRDSTGCEFGDYDCFNRFMFHHVRERKAFGYPFHVTLKKYEPRYVKMLPFRKIFGQKWWHWSPAGQNLWRKCKLEGEGSAFWMKENCKSRRTPDKFSEWWWFTEEGQKTWEKCKLNGIDSRWWKFNRCSEAR